MKLTYLVHRSCNSSASVCRVVPYYYRMPATYVRHLNSRHWYSSAASKVARKGTWSRTTAKCQIRDVFGFECRKPF